MNCRRSNLTVITMTTGREKCSVPGFIHVSIQTITISSKLWKLLERERQLNNYKIRYSMFNVIHTCLTSLFPSLIFPICFSHNPPKLARTIELILVNYFSLPLPPIPAHHPFTSLSHSPQCTLVDSSTTLRKDIQCLKSFTLVSLSHITINISCVDYFTDTSVNTQTDTPSNVHNSLSLCSLLMSPPPPL